MPDQRRETLVRKMIEEGTSDDDIRSTLKAFDAQPAPAAPVAPTQTRGWPATLKDVGIGVMKGAGSSLAGLGEMAVNAGMVPGKIPAAFNPAFRDPMFTRAEEATTATNTPQRVGKALEFVGEMALPTGKTAKSAVEAIPSTVRAGAKFQNVMAAAKDIPVDISAPGNVALRISELADRGGSMPMAVRKFINHVTDPNKPAMTYDVARDFASNISKLSANELGKLTPVVARQVAEMHGTLNKAVAEAAGKAGKGKEFAQAMNEYARAKRLENAIGSVVEGAKKAAPYAGGAGAGYWLTKNILGMLGG